MAKKNISNVVIKDEELTPTTLGVYSNKTKNPIGIILLIIMFIAIVIFMPNIQTYINNMLGRSDTNTANNNNNNNNGNNNGDPTPSDPTPNDKDDEKYNISSDTKIETSSYLVSDITRNGNTLSLKVLNKLESVLDLTNYFLEFYSSEGTFLNRIKLSNDQLQTNDFENYTFEIQSQATQFAFVKKSESDYPKVTLNYNENMEAELVCKSGNKTYGYKFIDDNLDEISYSYILDPNSVNYINEVQDYQNKASAYTLIDGVKSATYTNNTFNYAVALNKLDLTKINDDNLFKYKTSPTVVKFIEESKGYTCSQI